MIWALFIFLTFGLLVSAVLVLYQKSAVHSALFLILTFLFLAGFYLMLGAEFIAAVHVIVYAGAIMILFLFVIMLLNMKGDTRGFIKSKGKRLFSIILAMVVLLLIVIMLIPQNSGVVSPSTYSNSNNSILNQPNTQSVGILLYTKYILPFEIASVLLLVAMLGAVVLAKKEI